MKPGLYMQGKGLEPSLYCYNRHLKPARLPIPPSLRVDDTDSDNFTIICISRQDCFWGGEGRRHLTHHVFASKIYAV